MLQFMFYFNEQMIIYYDARDFNEWVKLRLIHVLGFLFSHSNIKQAEKNLILTPTAISTQGKKYYINY